MLKEMCVLAESIENAKLLALFNTLGEIDKDIVISISESLVEKWKMKMTYIVRNGVEKNIIYDLSHK